MRVQTYFGRLVKHMSCRVITDAVDCTKNKRLAKYSASSCKR